MGKWMDCTVAGRYNAEQCATGRAVWVHICGVCGVLIDFLQICLEVFVCIVCESCVAFCYFFVRVCVCTVYVVFICSKLVGPRCDL